MPRDRRGRPDIASGESDVGSGTPGKRSAADRVYGEVPRRAAAPEGDEEEERLPFLDVLQLQDAPVADPIVRGSAEEATQLSSHLAAMRALSADFVAARDRLDTQRVGDVGMALVRAVEEAERARQRLAFGVEDADLLGPTGLGFDADADGSRHAARNAELTDLKERRDALDVDHAAWSIVVANRVRPRSFRGQDIAGVSATLPPDDLPAFVREQVVKTILLLDAADEIRALRAARHGHRMEAMVGFEQEAVNRLQFWVSDREGFLFLSHAVEQIGEGSLLDRRGADGSELRLTRAAVARGVPQRMDEVIEVVREAKARALDNPPDPEGAARLVELARTRLDQLVQYHKVRAAIPKGTHGRTLEDAWRLAQDAQLEVHSRWEDLKLGRQFGEGVWNLTIKRLEAGATILDVVTGETAYEASPYPMMARGADMAPAMVGASAAAAVAPAVGLRAAAAVAEVGSAAYTAATILVVRNPYAATAITEFAASIGFNVADAGGLDNFLEGLKTPEGVLQVALEVLALKQSLGGGRYASDDGTDSAGAARPSSGVADEVLDAVDRVRAVKGAVVETGARPRLPSQPDADGGSEFSTTYTSHLEDHRQARATRREMLTARAEAVAAAELSQIQVTVAREPGAPRGSYRITPTDGRRIASVFRDIDGAEVIEYRAGILLRHDGQEWYFELSDVAHAPGASRARALTPDDDGLGLPAANVSTVELWGFRGVREIQKPGDAKPRGPKQWTDDERAEVESVTSTNPLLDFGHVGVSFDGGKTVYALTPRVTPDVTIPEIKRRLKDGEIFPGTVDNDRRHFDLATRMAEQSGWNTQPTHATVLLTPAEGARIRAHIDAQRRQAPDTEIGEYGFPKSGNDCAGVNNCATYPRSIGLPIPEESGNLRDYIPALERWARADTPIDARPQDASP